MKKALLASVLFFLLGLAPRAPADGLFNPAAFKEFSADFSMTSPTQVVTGKYYQSGSKLRMEMKDMPGARSATAMAGMAMIFDIDTRTMMSIVPQQKMVMIMPMEGMLGGAMPRNPKDDIAGVTSDKVLGKEKLDGHPCTIHQITTTGKDGQTHVMKVWSAEDLKGFPIQMKVDEGKSDVTFRYTNINQSAPDPRLFEAPAGYQKMDMSSQMQMMKGQMQPGMIMPGMVPPGQAPAGQTP